MTTKELEAKFKRSRARAKTCNHEWNLSFEEWIAVWGDKIHLRGHNAGCYQMYRKDNNLAWDIENVVIDTQACKYRPTHPRQHADERTNAMFYTFIQQRNQANYRKEEWDIEFQAWKTIWDPLWEQRGRSSLSMNMTRINPLGVWTESNIAIRTKRQISQDTNRTK